MRLNHGLNLCPLLNAETPDVSLHAKQKFKMCQNIKKSYMKTSISPNQKLPILLQTKDSIL